MSAIVFFDLDGVLADFDRHADEQGKRVDGKMDWDALDYAWWSGMPECEGAKAFYDEVSAKHTTKFLTAPVLSEECFSGKAHWVGEFTKKGKFAFTDLIVCPKKDKHFLAKPSHILIDDNEGNIRDWEAAGGIGIHHDGDFDKTRAKLAEAIDRVEQQENRHAARVAAEFAGRGPRRIA